MKTLTAGCNEDQPTNPESDPFQMMHRSADDLQARISGLPEELREMADEILLAYTNWAASDATLRWRIGKLVSEVSRSAKRGDNAVRKIAAALGCSPDKLYQCMRVAETWPDGIDGFFPSEEEPNQLPITWSHLVELERLKDGRDKLLKQTKAEGWTAEKLRDRVTALNGKDKAKGDRVSKANAKSEAATAFGQTEEQESPDTSAVSGDEEAREQDAEDRDVHALAPLGSVLERIRDWTKVQEQHLPRLRRQAVKLDGDIGEEVRERAMAEIDDVLKRYVKVGREIHHLLKATRNVLGQ